MNNETSGKPTLATTSIREWIETPDLENFLAVYDVLIDIQKELNVAAEGEHVDIPMIPPVIKFSELLPRDTVALRDQYYSRRWKVTKFLVNKGVIRGFKIQEGFGLGHRWQKRMLIAADRGPVSEALADMHAEHESAWVRPLECANPP